MQNSTYQQLDQRTDHILATIGSLPVSSETFVELAEIQIALEDAPIKPVVVARLTITRALGNLTIVEVWEDASFSRFYKIFTQNGRRRSTKRLVRAANRNEGLKPYTAHAVKPGLEVLAAHWLSMPQVASVKVRIIRKRAYKRLISASPDQLGMTTSTVNLPLRSFSPLSNHSFNVTRHS
jgi:hypothetical protein